MCVHACICKEFHLKELAYVIMKFASPQSTGYAGKLKMVAAVLLLEYEDNLRESPLA
jgi:hypothetical protein